MVAAAYPSEVLNRVVDSIVFMPDGCWNWTGSMTGNGYGRIGYGGRVTNGGTRERAHRVTYRWLKGPIPVGTELDHRCRNTRCVNPNHLEAVTHRVNIQRARGSEFRCGRGHERTPENTYTNPQGGRGCRECIRIQDRERRRRYRRARKEVV